MYMMLKIGHRGACGYEPENTFLSFQKALDLGVDMIELDVHACKTGELAVIHDKKVDRTTNGNGYVREMTLDDLRELDAGKGQKIPILQEVFDLVDRKVKINIELKGADTAIPTLTLIEKYIYFYGWSYDDFLISSYNQKELKIIKNLNPDIKTGVLIAYFYSLFYDAAWLKTTLNVYSINLETRLLSWNFVNYRLINDAHKNDVKVFVCTINECEEIEGMKKAGVDGMFSNFPDRI